MILLLEQKFLENENFHYVETNGKTENMQKTYVVRKLGFATQYLRGLTIIPKFIDSGLIQNNRCRFTLNIYNPVIVHHLQQPKENYKIPIKFSRSLLTTRAKQILLKQHKSPIFIFKSLHCLLQREHSLLPLGNLNLSLFEQFIHILADNFIL